jgi:hypothetical protein
MTPNDLDTRAVGPRLTFIPTGGTCNSEYQLKIYSLSYCTSAQSLIGLKDKAPIGLALQDVLFFSSMKDYSCFSESVPPPSMKPTG